MQENLYPSANTNSYKDGLLEFETNSYCDDHLHDYQVTEENNGITMETDMIRRGYTIPNTALREGPAECELHLPHFF